MLRNVSDLIHYKLGAQDGEIGKVRDFYFDDQEWVIRYLVADTGNWLSGRQVLISPFALAGVSETEKHVNVELTRMQIEEAPSVETDQPVSRQFEADYYKYYGWPMYWYGPALWGPGPYPVFDHVTGERVNSAARQDTAPVNPHLRSIREVTTYHIQAVDDDMGHVEDFVLDDENWAIRYIVVNTRNWWPGKRVLIAPQWIKEISWERSKVSVALHRDTIRQAPEDDESRPITREYEERLYQHYKRERYWPADPAVQKPGKPVHHQ